MLFSLKTFCYLVVCLNQSVVGGFQLNSLRNNFNKFLKFVGVSELLVITHALFFSLDASGMILGVSAGGSYMFDQEVITHNIWLG